MKYEWMHMKYENGDYEKNHWIDMDDGFWIVWTTTYQLDDRARGNSPTPVELTFQI